jgi:mycofactocin system glycosyltransferase
VNRNAPLPAGFRLAVDADTKLLDESTLFGGSPARVMRLSAAGRTAWTELQDGPIASPAAGVLGRRLSDAGLAHPEPPPLTGTPDVTVIVPVRDRAEMLDRCLTSLGHAHPVLVVDDGSADAAATAEVVAEHAARLLRRPASGGPAAARNSGLGAVTSELVAFVDSDCVVEPRWVERLVAHFADPLVAAVAPRVFAVTAPTWAGRHSAAGGGLDLGDRAARVVPGTRVSFVPTAALVVRRSALPDVLRDNNIFDPDLRYGEDVDLVWRLHEAGWRVRYDPAVRVRHHEPAAWPDLLTRRFHYGTSAGPLARRHPSSMAPLVLQPWPTVTVAALLARRPVLAGLAFAASVIALRRTVRRAGLPPTGIVGAMATGVHQTWLGLGRYGTQFAGPLLLAGLLAPGGSTPVRRWGRRAAVASLLLGRPLTTWMAGQPTLDPVRFVLGQVADDVAYGAGVWAGSLRARTGIPLRPAVSWRPFRVSRTPVPAAEAAVRSAG